MSSTQLDNSNVQATHHKEHRNQIIVRLLAEGSVVVMLIAIGWWGMAHLGNDTLSSESDSLTAKRPPVYVAGCPVVDKLQESSDAGEGKGCPREGSSHPITSRQPGGGLGKHGADR
jgi:hypothetical protein